MFTQDVFLTDQMQDLVLLHFETMLHDELHERASLDAGDVLLQCESLDEAMTRSLSSLQQARPSCITLDAFEAPQAPPPSSTMI